MPYQIDPDKYMDEIKEDQLEQWNAEKMSRQNEQAKFNAELALDIFRAYKYGTKQ